MKKVLLLLCSFLPAIPVVIAQTTCPTIREEEGEWAYRICNLEAQEKSVAESVKKFKERIELQKENLDFIVEQQLNVLEQQWREADLRYNEQVNRYEQLIGQMELQEADDAMIEVEQLHLDTAEDLQSLQKKLFNEQKKQIANRRKLDEQALNITLIQQEIQLRNQLLYATGY